MLIRRFFQSDLRPSAYATAVYRITLVLLIVTVLHQVLSEVTAVAGRAELAIAFVVGFFPLVGLQALQRVTSRALRRFVPPVTSDYPLDQLDGFNLWYEARLTEEGVEDMQNLTTMNLVDVILHTRVPPGRLVDWTDQAFLLTHLERVDRAELNQLRQAGQQGPARGRRAGAAVRCAGQAEPQARRHPDRDRPAQGVLGRAGDGERAFRLPDGLEPPLPSDQLRLLVTVLAAEPGLVPVWNWQRNGVPECRGPTAASPAGGQGMKPLVRRT